MKRWAPKSLPRISGPVLVTLIGLAVVAGWLLPQLLLSSQPLPAYWLVLPAAIAGIRFGLFGAVITSGVSWAIIGPLAGVLADVQPDQRAGFGVAVFYVTVSVTVAFLVRRVRHADQRVLDLVTQQREQARHAARERGSLTEELERRIHEDSLTGLSNRTAFVIRLEDCLRRNPDRTAVLFIDLDDFKTVNDTLGHAVGDELIMAVGRRLAQASRTGDLVARFGGDEFAVLLDDVAGDDALRPAQRILAELKTPFNLCGRTLVVRASGGLAVSEGSLRVAAEQRALDLLKEADLAMYASKVQRTRGVTMFHEGMQTEMRERLALESDMNHGLADAQFFLEYQPIIEMRTGGVRAVEALLRWHHPERGLINPAMFIPVAEQTGMIVALTLWVVRTAAAQLHQWDEDPVTAGLSVAINVSGRLVVEPGVGAAMARELHYAGIDPRRVILEITESLLMEDKGSTVQTLCQLRALGMRLSVDDFGTGYSSLSRLNTLPIDEVKIDQSFVERLDSESGRTIVTATIGMAHGLGLRVVAEGLESERQRDALRIAGCDDVQGYLYSRPIAADAVKGYLQIADPGRSAQGGAPFHLIRDPEHVA